MIGRRLSPVFLLFTSLYLVQCASLFKKAFTNPRVAVEEVKFDDIDIAGVTLTLYISVDNPNSIGVTLSKLAYLFNIEGQTLVTGVKSKPLVIEGKKKNLFSLPLQVRYDGLSSGIAGVLNKKSLAYEFKGKITLDTPVGDLNFDIDRKGEIPVPDRPRFSVEKVSVAEMGLTSATIRFDIKITNNEDIAIDIDKFDYRVALNDVEVSQGNVEVQKAITKNNDFTLGVPVNLKFLGLKSSLIKVVRSGKFKYKFTMNLNMNSKYGPYKLGYDKESLVSLY